MTFTMARDQSGSHGGLVYNISDKNITEVKPAIKR